MPLPRSPRWLPVGLQRSTERVAVQLTRAAVGMPATPAAVWAVLRRPTVWISALRAARMMRPDPGMGSDAFFRFRAQTQMGGSGADPIRAHDLIAYLEWARATREVLQ